MFWPWLRALTMVALPMGATLNFSVWLCHGYFPIATFMTLGMWACHGLGSMPMVVALALPTCPLEGYFSKKGFFIFFLFLFFFSQMKLFGQANIPWPLSLSCGSYLGLCCMT